MFVPGRYMAAPRVRTYIVPVYRRTVLLRATRVVNRTVPVQGARLAVNPGISPAFVARVSGAPIATYRVRPRVFAATQGVTGAVQVRRDELRGAGGPRGVVGPVLRPGVGTPRLGAVPVQRTNTVIQPSAAATAPQPLGKHEPGQLGPHPPRAAQGAVPSISTPRPGSPQQTVAPSLPPAVQRQTPPGQQTAPKRPAAPGQVPSAGLPNTVAPGRDAAVQRQERRERMPPGGLPSQPNIVRPIPPQIPPGAPPPQPRQVQPPPQPAPPPQRQVQPIPPSSAAPLQRQVQPPTGAHAPPAATARAAGPPPKKPPPKPGEKQEEKK